MRAIRAVVLGFNHTPRSQVPGECPSWAVWGFLVFAHSQVQPESAVSDEIPRRVLGLDAARGYATCVIVLGPLFESMKTLPNIPFIQTLREHFSTHVAWHGVNYIDMGFPFYLLIVGMAITLSLGHKLHQPDKRTIYFRVIKRSIVLFALGLIYNGGLSREWPEIRIAGVLQRIAICYCIGAFVFLNLRLKSQIVLFVAILLGYWAMLAWIPVPDGGGKYTFEGNVAAYVDRCFLPGRKLFGSWDPEGLLTTLPAFTSCLAGIITGEFLWRSKTRPQEVVLYLLLAAAACAAVGLLWSAWLPINKKLWTSSFVLITTGNTLLTFAVFYQIADVWRKPNWLFPFIIVGLNTLVAFMAMRLLPFHDLALRLVGGDIQSAFGTAGPLAIAATEALLCWLLLVWLYRCGIVLKA